MIGSKVERVLTGRGRTFELFLYISGYYCLVVQGVNGTDLGHLSFINGDLLMFIERLLAIFKDGGRSR